MTSILLAAMLSITLPEPAPWTTTDTHFQLALVALGLADVMQTRYFLDMRYLPDGREILPIEEQNPLLGKHPSGPMLYTALAGVLIGHFVIARALPQPWRRIWQVSAIGIETCVVGWNTYNIGSFSIKW
jgi:hypothetical protein